MTTVLPLAPPSAPPIGDSLALSAMDTDQPPFEVSQHDDHTPLLRPIVCEKSSGIDVIIVPSARAADSLAEVMEVAKKLNAPVLVLCSKASKASDVVLLAKEHKVTVYAADVAGHGILPRLMTDNFLARCSSRGATKTRPDHPTDISIKRNIGLAVARMMGWDSVLFLDDDIKVEDVDAINRAAPHLSEQAAVGLKNVGFPDNSVLCHARRDVGLHQATFVGGGAMVATTTRDAAFFPQIYNEDWFFLLDSTGIAPVAQMGQVSQKEYDPYAHPRRARIEEFGDCLAEGIYALLDGEREIGEALRYGYWRAFLTDRKRKIEDVIRRIPSLSKSEAEKARMIKSMNAARSRLQLLSPAMCVRYLALWQQDRERWAKFMTGLSRAETARQALDLLGFLGLASE
jgi:hypothetical protein